MVSKSGRKIGARGLLGVYLGLGVLGILICGYGYAAQSTDLLIEGEATVLSGMDIRNTSVTLKNATGGGSEGYNSKYTSNTASVYPQILQADGEVNYTIETCNTSETKSYELARVTYPVQTLGTMQQTLSNVKAGTELVLGTIVGPGECVNANLKFVQGAASSAVAAVTVDYKWVEYDPVKFASAYMQDFTVEECAEVSMREVTQMKDRRDNKIYWVGKMKDGKCWMTQNLDYDGGGAQYTEENIADWVSQPLSNEEQYYHNNDNNGGHASDGNYYSQAALTNPSDPVCPANWHLPSAAEWSTLLDGMGTGREALAYVMDAPFYLRLSGWIHHEGLKQKGNEAGYRTSTSSQDHTQILTLVPDGVSIPQDTFDWGANARCVAGTVAMPETLRSISTMQEMTTEICNNSTFGEMKQLTDERDGHPYWVSRLRNGKCWMVQNLDYDGGGTRYSVRTVGNWSSDYKVAQYVYRGDYLNGHESLGSYYSAAASVNVCPAGWRLPSGTETGEYSQLGPKTMDFYTAVRAPYYFRATGWVGEDESGKMGLYDMGTYGGLWTGSTSAGPYKFSFELLDNYFPGSQSVNLYRTSHVMIGYGVRCIYAGT